MAYAVGKYARATCDRCGFDYKYLDLRKEWNGLKTCPECYEPKHPQLDPPRHITDPEALREPRGTVPAPTTGYGIVKTGNPVDANGVSSPLTDINANDPIGSSFFTRSLTTSLGEVNIVT